MVDTQLFINNQRVCEIRVFRYNGLSPTQLLKVNCDLLTRIFPPWGTVHFLWGGEKMAFIFECNFHWHSSSYLLSSSSFSQLVLPWEYLSSMLQKAAMRLVTVLFRVHEGVNMGSDFLLKIGGDSASCSIGERISFQELSDVWSISSK